MRSFLKIAICVVLVAASCSACVIGAPEFWEHQLLGSDVRHEMYSDANWRLAASINDKTNITKDCTVWIGRDRYLIISAYKSGIVDIEVSRISAEYLAGKTIMLSIHLSAAFSRRLEFEVLAPRGARVVLGGENFHVLKAALQSPEAKSVTFDDGMTWRFPPPENPDLAAKLGECLESLGG